MTEMTPRERIETALNHQEPDRVPLDIGGGQSSSLTAEAYENLAQYLGISAPMTFLNTVYRAVRLDEQTLARLGSDTRPVTLRAGTGPAGPPKVSPSVRGESTFVDEMGITWHQVHFGGGYYWEQSVFPLQDATIDDLPTYEWPDPDDPRRYEGLAEEVQHLYRDTPYALVGDCGYKNFWEPTFALLGYERALMALLAEEEFIHALMERLFTIVSTVTRRFLEITGPYLSVVRTSDDLATQRAPMMSPDTYRKVIKPFHKRYFELIKRYTDAKIFFHTDGNIVELLDDLIDAGVEVLNPVQVSALKDPASVKAAYGDRLSFWGGIDTQSVLPRGTPQDVRDEVQLRIKQFSAGGGFVAASVHNIQADVPPENILAMCDAIHEFGSYAPDRRLAPIEA
jgi:uroporphyrinogen decarboxylase